MKTYTFEFPITGTCYTTVEAETDEEAVRKLQKDCDLPTELGEWNVDWPNFFEELDTEDMMKHCAAIDDGESLDPYGFDTEEDEDE